VSIVDLLSDDRERRESRRRIPGVAPAIVTDNQDPEDLGRVKVSFPWHGEQSESNWVRITSPRGSFFLPEVDDEVLVAFEQGDINCPYVIGGLWNNQAPPQETNQDGQNNIRTIQSRSGHQLTFNDNAESGQERVELRSNAGHEIILDDASGEEKVIIRDKTGNNTIEFDSTQNTITIESAMKLKISAQQIEIEAGATMTIKANGTLTLEGALIQIN
jgi:uncharacterized protein involved in type VI secretion and phage assembly